LQDFRLPERPSSGPIEGDGRIFINRIDSDGKNFYSGIHVVPIDPADGLQRADAQRAPARRSGELRTLLRPLFESEDRFVRTGPVGTRIKISAATLSLAFMPGKSPMQKEVL
jgi:hypothetical protein